MNQAQAIKANKTAVVATIAVLLFSFLGASNASAAFWAVNENTGFSSTNLLEAEGEDEFTLTNTNFGGVDNSQLVDTETGLNASDSNTGNGTTNSGNIGIGGGFANVFNSNDSSYENSWWEQMVVSGNDTTGASSFNEAEAEFENEVEVDQTNTANLDNDIVVDANTGDNSASTNTGTGDVKTGEADATTTEANVATGFDSDNDAESEVENDMDVDSTNTAMFANLSSTILNTGKNVSDSNTGMGGVDSGNAEGNTSIANDANANAVDIEIVGDDDNSLAAVNDTTGAESTNDVETEVESDIDVDNDNDAELTSKATMNVNTGDNTSSTNTGSGDVLTGNREGNIMISNGGSATGRFFNENTTSLMFTSSMFDLMAGNDTTGFMSDNDAEAELENEVDVVNVNSANVTNTATGTIETGLNASDSNTGNGKVDTGNADAGVSIVNDLNVNQTTVQQMAVGMMVAGNDTTGASSTNDVEVEMENELTITNTNEVTLVNTSVVDSSTGSNSSSFNTGSGSSVTGNSSVLFGIINQGNGNFNIVECVP